MQFIVKARSRQLPGLGNWVVLLAAGALAVAVAMSTKGAATSCGLPDDLPFGDIKVAQAEAGAAANSLSKGEALAKADLAAPGRTIKDGMLARVTFPERPEQGSALAWVFTRTEPVRGAFDAIGQPAKATFVCGITIIDAATGDLIVVADDSIAQ